MGRVAPFAGAHQQAVDNIIDWLYSHRYADGLLTYMDEYIMFLSGRYLISTISAAAQMMGTGATHSLYIPTSLHPKDYDD